MKINRVIIIGVCFIGITLAIYLAFKTKLTKTSSVDNEYVQIKKSYDNMSDNLKMLDGYKNEENQLLNEIDGLNMLQNIHQEDIINILDDIMISCGVNAGKITFSEISAVNFNELDVESKEVQHNNDENNIEAQTMTVSIEFTCDYENFILFIDQIQNSDTEITVTNVSVISSDLGEIRCLINLNFYALVF